jgi:hypothetical protein
MPDITVFLPFHSNGVQVEGFLRRLSFAAFDNLFCHVHLLDCGGISPVAYEQFERHAAGSPHIVVSYHLLSSRTYWGHSLNYIIKILRNATYPVCVNSVLIANADVYISADVLVRAIELLRDYPLLACDYAYLSSSDDFSCFQDVDLSELFLISASRSAVDFLDSWHYLPTISRFGFRICDDLPCNYSSFAPTCAFFFSWSALAPKIPRSFKVSTFFYPHYYSDYAFTRSLSRIAGPIYSDRSLHVLRLKNSTPPTRSPFSISSPVYFLPSIMFRLSFAPPLFRPLYFFYVTILVVFQSLALLLVSLVPRDSSKLP